MFHFVHFSQWIFSAKKVNLLRNFSTFIDKKD